VWLCVDKHLSVIIQGDVDVARAMEQTSTITRQLTFCVLPLTTVFLSLSLHCTIMVLPGTCSYWILDVHLYKLFRDNFMRRQKKTSTNVRDYCQTGDDCGQFVCTKTSVRLSLLKRLVPLHSGWYVVVQPCQNFSSAPHDRAWYCDVFQS